MLAGPNRGGPATVGGSTGRRRSRLIRAIDEFDWYTHARPHALCTSEPALLYLSGRLDLDILAIRAAAVPHPEHVGARELVAAIEAVTG